MCQVSDPERNYHCFYLLCAAPKDVIFFYIIFLYPHFFFQRKEKGNHITFLSILRYCQEIERYKLGDPQTFHYLNQSTCFELDDVDDAHDYLATRKAMDVVGISKDEQVIV